MYALGNLPIELVTFARWQKCSSKAQIMYKSKFNSLQPSLSFSSTLSHHYIILILSQLPLDTICSRRVKTAHTSTPDSRPGRLRIEFISSIPAVSLLYELFYPRPIVPAVWRVSATADFHAPSPAAVVIVENGGHFREGY